VITDVGIDMDGVMYDFANTFKSYCENRLQVNSPLPEPKHWEFYEDWGLDKETFYDWLTDATVNDSVFYRGNAYDNTMAGWRKLKAMGMRIHVLTHRHIEAVGQTAEWLQDHNFVPDSIHFGFDKTLLEAIAIDQAAAIDDYTKYYDEYEKVGVKAFLRTHEWNKDHHGRRVDDLLGFADAVETYNNYYKFEEWRKPIPFSTSTTYTPVKYQYAIGAHSE
jgi:hypothetical protein